MPYGQQWKLAMKGLEEKGELYELNPATWEDYYFSTGVDGFKLANIMAEEEMKNENA